MTKHVGLTGRITDAPAHRDRTGGTKGVARRVISLPPAAFASAARETAEAQPLHPMAAGTRRRCPRCGVTNFTRDTGPGAGFCPIHRMNACVRRQQENIADGLMPDGTEPPAGVTVLESRSVITTPPEEAMSQKTIILADMREHLSPTRPWGATQGVEGTSGDIARRTHIVPHDVTHALYDLMKQGYVTFKPTGKRDAPADGKGALTHLRLTQKGLNFPLSNGEATPEPEPPKVQAGPVADVEGYLEDRSGYREAQRNTLQATVEGIASALLIEVAAAEGVLTSEEVDALATRLSADFPEDEDTTPEPLPSPHPLPEEPLYQIADELVYERVIDLGAVNEGLIAKLAALEGGDLEGRFPILHELVTRESSARKTMEAAYLLRLAGQNTLADMAAEAGRVTFEPWEQEVVELLLLLGSEHDA